MQRLGILLIAVCIACKPASQQSTKPAAAAGPAVRATVITVRTTLQPQKRTIEQSIVVAGDLARDTTERDTWRLYDTKAQTVTFIDDVDRTIRTESFANLRRQRSVTMAAQVAAFHPRPVLKRGETKAMQGATARQWVITAGAYKRELWMAEHPSIPRGLFAMMQASERVSSPLAPIMREVEAALLDEKGFPLLDRSEIPLGSAPAIVERTVVAIAQKDVPQSLVTVPKGYRDRTPKK
ncbi:MAG TPA: hypothetical protein VHW00_23245 [Thermoanaerobaculia bacterium]|nr:hypothetical protein [Thermoanaerobaculia bacterium]